MVMMVSYTKIFMLLLVVGFAAASAENYDNYRDDEYAERDLENLRELYKLLFHRFNPIDNDNNASPLAMALRDQHLMTRKSVRSPSLRLRFGRSDPALSPAALMTRSSSRDAAFDDN